MCRMMDLEGEKIMTIRYANGHTVEAVLLSRTENGMRVALQGSEDVLVLSQVNGLWVTEECEPVEVRFAWESPAAPPVAEADFICSPELAARLIDMLHNGDHAETKARALAMSIPAAPIV